MLKSFRLVLAVHFPLALSLIALVLLDGRTEAGLLFVGSDNTEFVTGAPPDILGKYTTSGAAIVSGGNITTNYAFNGLGEGQGFLYAGQYNSNTIRRIDYNGNSLGVFSASVPNAQFNEDMGASGLGTFFYHAYYGGPSSGQIRKLNFDGTVLELDNTGFGVVGVAEVGTDVWISNWAAQQVGIWNFATNTFTTKFSTSSLGFAGALAYDADTNTLWLGTSNGFVTPWNPTTGQQINAGFRPFGNITNTIDGLAFVPDTQLNNVPEPTSATILGLGALGLAWFGRRSRKTSFCACHS